MARPKIPVDMAELQEVINQLETEKLFSSPYKLFEAVAATPWGVENALTAVIVYSRIKAANADPDNPSITMRVRPARKVKPRDGSAEGSTTPRRSKYSIGKLDTLVETFRNRGVELTDISQLITSSHRTREENRVILLAWADLRDFLGCPKPVKIAREEEEPLVPLSVSDEETGESTPLVVESELTVTEEYPDGSPVFTPEVLGGDDLSQVEQAVTQEDGLVLDVEPVGPVTVAPVVTPGAAPTYPGTRPSPVRSPVPPRPMPVGVTSRPQ